MRSKLTLVFPILLASVPIVAGPPLEEGASPSTAGFVGVASQGPIGEAVLVQSREEFEAIFGAELPGSALPAAVRGFFANGGRRLYVARAPDASVDALLGSKGLEALATIDEIAIVAIPSATSPSVAQALIAHCERLGDRVAIIDGPEGDASDALAQREALVSAKGFGVVYWPWLEVEAAAGATVLVPPSGHVAGAWARNDRDAGVWSSPVGAIAGVIGTAHDVREQDVDLLSPHGVNPIRELGGSVQIFGARTIASDAEWIYVPVRRFLLFLEESLGEGTSWVVFEPNGEELWASLRAAIEDHLLDLFRRGAFQGAKPEDAFFVRVDRTTMTEADLDAGRTIALVGVALLRPAEFTLLRLVHVRGAAAPLFRRGDANLDEGVDISDAVFLLAWLFSGGTALACADSADANDDGRLDVSDPVYALDWLFRGGPAPPAPGPSDCGEDPTTDELDECDASAMCPGV